MTKPIELSAKLARLIAATGADNYLDALRKIRRMRKRERRGKVMDDAAMKKIDAHLERIMGAST